MSDDPLEGFRRLERFRRERDIFKLAQLSLPKPTRRQVPPAIRPERPALPLRVKDNQARERWALTAFQTQAEKVFELALTAVLYGIGGGFTEFRSGAPVIFGSDHWYPANGFKDPKAILTCTTAILWDILSRPDPVAAIGEVHSAIALPVVYVPFHIEGRNPLLSPLIEHMLFVDYGIGEFPLRKPRFAWARRTGTTRKLWMPALYQLAARLSDHAGECCLEGMAPPTMRWYRISEDIDTAKLTRCGDLTDVALMLYHFHTHRRIITKPEVNIGLTGYTGVIDEMEADVPKVGSDRLLRKLSVDLNIMIPKHVQDPDRRARMVEAIESIARKHEILHLLKPQPRPYLLRACEARSTKTASHPPPPPYLHPPPYPKTSEYRQNTSLAPILESEDTVQDSRGKPFVPMMAQFPGFMW